MVDWLDAAIVVALVASTWCWWHIRRSRDPFIVKFVLTLIVAVPILGALIYVLVQLPSRRPPAPPEGEDATAYVRRWHGREHVYLAWTSAVFWGLAVVAYWIHGWDPGHIVQGRFGAYTTIDVTFFSLLVGAVVTFGLAVRAKVLLVREAIDFELQHQRHLETQ
jgi:hypothetical protein